jgi:hypothetical protein
MTTSTPHAPSSGSGTTCPRCRATEKWGMSSWCPKCGYYPAVDGKRDNGSSWADELTAPQTEEDTSSEDEGLLSAVPPWMWQMMLGVCGIVGMSLFVKATFDGMEQSPGAWAWAQLIAGMVSLVTAHGLASKFAMSKDRRLNFGDVILAWPSIWQPTVSILPVGNLRICSAIWGATAAVSSMLLIGGHDVGQFFRDKEEVAEDEKSNLFGKVVGTATAVAKESGKKASSLEEALKNIGEGEVVAMVDELANKLPTDKEMTCRVYGYLKGENGQPIAFFLCTQDSHGFNHVAKVSTEKMTEESINFIALKVVGQERSTPICETDDEAIWVNPIVEGNALYAEKSDAGEYQNVRLVSVLKSSSTSRKVRKARPSTARRTTRPTGSTTKSAPTRKVPEDSQD